MPSITPVIYIKRGGTLNIDPDFNGIVVWDDGVLVARHSHGIIIWTIRKSSVTFKCTMSVSGESLAFIFIPTKEEFFRWIENNSPGDLEWLIWNLDTLGI